MTYVLWCCKSCRDVRMSSDYEHHQMDVCACEKSGLDLEKDYARMMGGYLFIKEFKWDFLKELYIGFNEQGFEEGLDTYGKLKHIERELRAEMELEVLAELLIREEEQMRKNKSESLQQELDESLLKLEEVTLNLINQYPENKEGWEYASGLAKLDLAVRFGSKIIAECARETLDELDSKALKKKKKGKK